MKEIKKYISENKPNHFNEDIEHGIDHEIAILKHHYSKFNKLPPTPEFANYWLSLLRNGSDYQRGGFLNCFKKKIRIKES